MMDYLVRTLKQNKRWISLAILTAVVGLIVRYIAINWHEFADLSLVHSSMLLVLLGASLLDLYSMGRSMDIVLRPLGLSLSRKETFGLVAITRLFNQIAPGKLGLAVRGGYLKRKHGFPFSQFVSTLAATNIIMYAVSAVFGLMAIWFLSFDSGISWFAGLFVLILLGSMLALIVSVRLPIARLPVLRHTSKALEGWYIIRSDYKILVVTAWWVCIKIVAQAVTTYAAFLAVGLPIGAAEAIFIGALVAMAGLIAVTPGGLGITEGIIVIAATAIGLPAAPALAAALLRRLAGFVVALSASIFYTRQLLGTGIIRTMKLYWHDSGGDKPD